MADDLVPDWRVQVSFKFGPTNRHGEGQNLLNVRADDPSELGDLLVQIDSGLADKVASASSALGVLQVVTDALGSVSDVTPPAGAGSTAPRCAHGVRTYKSGVSGKGPWAAFFCSLPQGASGKCEAIFKDKTNKHEPFWPQEGA